MKLLSSIFFFLIIVLYANAEKLENHLLPEPQKLEYTDGFLNIQQGITAPNKDFIKFIESMLSFNISGSLKFYTNPLVTNTFSCTIDSTLKNNQEYLLLIDSTSISIIGKDEAALFYGKQTLKQIIDYCKSYNKPVPCLKINDWPHFERRGYMLDISRDKVPTMKTLFHIIDMLAYFKINEFQLYTEHTFAYKNHKTVWENANPITPKEIQILDAYCKSNYIDLVPNQNSFGHMENWLKHDEYLHLAECPNDCKTIWGTRSRHSLNPTNPQSFELMQELYNELLPNFSSQYFNIGCDETVELGCGLSKDYCEEKGKGAVYLEYVEKLNNEVNKHQRKSQFWGDIILNHPELIPSIPKNMTAMVWGYESTYPFEANLPKFKNAGLDFYVCPGTSTWRSIIGRNHDAFINLRRAAKYGRQYGAKGYLNTNWGDYGHWQPLSVCYPALIVGAGYSWNTEVDASSNLETILNEHLFKDKTGNLGKALLCLGDAYLACKIPEGNANAFHLMLRRYKWTMQGHYQTKKLSTKNLLEAEVKIDKAKKILNTAKPECADATIIKKELNQAINLAKHGIHLGIARLSAKKQATENIDIQQQKLLAEELKVIIDNHQKLWLYRNRTGGLSDSSQKMKDLLEYYTVE
ncbi:beta-hexosaminidase [Labilibacter sediminis]|nr:beta-hexosaminidase [Labilibacter sediminis]